MGLFSKLLGRSKTDALPVSEDDLRALYAEDAEALKPEPVAQVPMPAPMRAPEPAPAADMSAEPEASVVPEQAQPVADAPDLTDTDAQIVDTTMERSGGANIWDIEDDASDDDTPAADETTTAPGMASSARNLASTRARRNRTRLIGFDKSDGAVVDLFNGEPEKAATARVQFPVGWLLVVEGPGRGHSFAIVAGMSQIGRGADQTVQLDFGDTAISRNNHAAVVFDSETGEFMLGHGGKANIVRLNGKPVISNETLQDGDKIKIGDTTLQLKALCGPDFNWTSDDADGEEHEDVAIA